jgi:hypothetical protein
VANAALSERVQHELRQAERFRSEGRIGRARVCARRAAGWAIGPAYRRSTGETPPGNAMSLLRWYHDSTDAPDHLRRAAGRLTTRVTRDHGLPHPEDPVEDARMLVEGLQATDD